MLGAIAVVYILLCVRIRVRLEASWENGLGSAAFCVGALGVYLRRDFVIDVQAYSIRAIPRYGKEKKNAQGRAKIIRKRMLEALRSGCFESIMLHVRLGLGDACVTAIAAGALHALGSMVFSVYEGTRQCELCITPDFSKACLCVHLQGIFSWQVGDIMIAALKRARRKRKEGLKWTSIPLRV